MTKFCLFTDEELRRGEHQRAIVVRGVTVNFGFHPDRLEACRSDAIELIQTIVTNEFFEDSGGGWSLFQLGVTREGEIWGEHRTVEDFLCLCLGLDLCSYCCSAEFWALLPGGLPYVVFRKTARATHTPSSQNLTVN